MQPGLRLVMHGFAVVRLIVMSLIARPRLTLSRLLWLLGLAVGVAATQGVAWSQAATPSDPAVAAEAPTATLIIRLTNVPAQTQNVVVALFSSEETFLTEQTAYGSHDNAVIEGQTATVVIEEVVAGAYGIVVFADEDGDLHQSFAMGFFPIEHYGFGNNAKGLFGPPSFADTVLTVSTPQTAVDIELIAPPFDGLW